MTRLVLLLCWVATVTAFEPIQQRYHDNVGVPLAEAIRQAEMSTDFDGSRIVGGSPAALGDYPYMGGLLMLLDDGRTSIGGSTLISNTKVLTAAHNLFDGFNRAREVTVVLGSIHIFSGGTRITSNVFELHSGFDIRTVNNDIAIITISWVNYNNVISNIALASGSNTYAGSWAWAAGFGKTSDLGSASPDLLHARLQVITNAACRDVFGSSFVIDSTLCVSGANRVNTCIGDSGGPLVADNHLIGVTSFSSGRGCEANLPSGFARVSAFNSWIRARM